MSVSGKYEKIEYIASGKKINAQSIVECRLNDWADNRVLAVNARAVYGGAEVLSGEVRYGGRLYFTVLAATPEGSVIGGERGAEFSHRAECESAAPAQTAEVALRVEKVEVRKDGRALVLSAILSAEIELFAPAEISYLSGGEGVVCDFRPVRLTQVYACRGEAEIEEEFDTDYVGDVLAHSETVFINRVVASAGALEVSGEINLGILAKREGESDTVSYERLIPFRAEIPCDDAVTGCGCTASGFIRSVNVSASCDEDKNRCRIAAEFTLELRGRVYRGENVHMSADAFCPGFESTLERAEIASREPVAAFTASERISGTAAISESVDFACALQAVAFGGCLAAASAEDGFVTCEGVVSAYVLMKDGEGNPKSCEVSLPFSFPVKCDRARKGQSAEVGAIACGIAARQKKEGELEAECALKLYFTLFASESSSAVTHIEAGEPAPECDVAVSVYVPCVGDGLWEIAKKLGRSPEEVRRTNAGLEFPLNGSERIVVYRKKEIGF
mgnify:CR=1 FL=1